jgi:hypothetical protein
VTGLAFAVDAANVYLASAMAPVGGIVKVPIAGGTPVTLAPLEADVAITVDATSVYWIGAEAGGSGALKKVPIAGGATTTLASQLPSTPTGSQLAVDDANVYWTNTPFGDGGPPTSCTVMRVPIAGGAPTTLAANRSPMTGLALNATSVIWSEWNGLFSLTPK